MRNHYVYKYVCNGQIIYIGKVDSDLQRRIDEHAAEDRFWDYPDAEVFCMKLNNTAETTCMEMLLINKYKPILNIKDKYPEILSIRFEEPSWVPAEDVLTKAEPMAEAPISGLRRALSQEIAFWEKVRSHAGQDKTDVFSIHVDEIRDTNPRGFSVDGNYYQVFTLRYDLASLAVFVYSVNGKEYVKRYLGEYIGILKAKEESVCKSTNSSRQ